MSSNITIKLRLIVTMTVLGLLIAILGVTSILGLKSANNTLNEVYSNQLASTQAIGESQILLGRARFTIDRAVVHPEAADAKDIVARGEQFIDSSNKSWKVYLALPQSPEEKILSDDLDKKRSDYINNGLLALGKALREGKTEQADALMMTGMTPLYRTMDGAAEKLTQFQITAAASMYAASQAKYDTQVGVAIAGLVIGLLMIVVSSILLLRAIFRPLDQALRHFDAIADGNLANDIVIERHDEMGALLGGLK